MNDAWSVYKVLATAWLLWYKRHSTSQWVMFSRKALIINLFTSWVFIFPAQCLLFTKLTCPASKNSFRMLTDNALKVFLSTSWSRCIPYKYIFQKMYVSTCTKNASQSRPRAAGLVNQRKWCFESEIDIQPFVLINMRDNKCPRGGGVSEG